MSSSSRSDGESSFDVEGLLEIGTRCIEEGFGLAMCTVYLGQRVTGETSLGIMFLELRKEKESLKESQCQSFELIKRLELHVKSLSEARSQDKEYILNMERELMNCSQEIDYLQDQLCERNSEVSYLKQYVDSLEARLLEMESLRAKVGKLREELERSDFERMLLTEELQNKELELQNSTSCIEKLESVLSMSLESQCETESMKLDMMALEQACFEAKKIGEENIQEKERMNLVIREREDQLGNALEIIEHLEKENRELGGKVVASERNSEELFHEIENLLGSKDLSELNVQSVLNKLQSKLTVSEEMRKVIDSLFSRAATVFASDEEMKEKMAKMSHQIHEYECIVEQLKKELREEKMNAKDEAEDLAQEMAELRYEMMHLLEEECKHHACIEQASFKKIAELEAQIKKETQQSLAVVRCHQEM